MLLRDPSGERPGRPPVAPAPSRVAVVLLTMLVLAVLILRHDYWNWDTPGFLLFGFLPVGLWWQALVSILACGMMWALVRFAWPHDIEAHAEHSPRQQGKAANPTEPGRPQ